MAEKEKEGMDNFINALRERVDTDKHPPLNLSFSLKALGFTIKTYKVNVLMYSHFDRFNLVQFFDKVQIHFGLMWISGFVIGALLTLAVMLIGIWII